MKVTFGRIRITVNWKIGLLGYWNVELCCWM